MKNKLEKSWVSLMENKAYKLLRVSKNHQGKIYPLFVNANHEIEMNEWIEAEYGEMNDKGKVKSKLGALCFRPGWHLSDIPYAPHIGKKGENGQIEFMNENNFDVNGVFDVYMCPVDDEYYTANDIVKPCVLISE